MMNLSNMDRGGLVLGMSRDRSRLYCNTDDTHTLIIGATRSGKSRNVVLPSICTMALAGESMVVVDPKAELYLYTYPYLERLGYEVVAIDFKEPLKSNRYNFLQPVIDAINMGDNALAVTRARDTATMLVPDRPESHTDPIWINGERSILMASILAVVADNQGRPEYQNLANAYQFIVEMGRPGPKGEVPLSRYLRGLSPEHPARLVAGISEVAPSKTRGSFFASGGSTLNVFTDPAIHTMTAATDFDLHTTGERKRAIFIILPDHKSTYYPIASLFVYQHYQALVDCCDRHGGRLPRRVNFICDEFGNFVKIPDFDKFMTVGGGRGIRFHLFLQDFNQIDEKYGDKVGRIIRANAETWIYLQTDNPETLEELSKKLGKYTIKSPGLSGNSGGDSSASYNFTGRDLLMPEEIKKIKRPYQLVTSRDDPCIMYAPDVSKTVFNRMLGLGSMDHNERVIQLRSARRPKGELQTAYWGIWNKYHALLRTSAKSEKGNDEE